jgi:multidrug efflux system membrane fusion protein
MNTPPTSGHEQVAKASPKGGATAASRATLGRRLGVYVLAALAFGATGYLAWSRAVNAQAAKAPSSAEAVPVAVATATARTGDIGVYVSALGTVTALNTVTVKTRVDGQLIEVPFKEGQLVRKEELLALVDPRPFEAQLMQAEGQLARDQASLKDAKLDLERFKVLAPREAIPKQQLDTQQSLVDQLQAAVKSDQGQIATVKINLVYARITSPIDGRVGLRLVDPGNVVQTTDTNGIVVITQVDPITVVFAIPEDNLPQVAARLRAGEHLAVEAWDRSLRTKLATGEVQALDNQIDPTTATVRIKALFGNTDLALFPNQFVNARLLVDTRRNATLVPTAAIQRGPQGPFVYVAKGGGTVELRKVTVGPSNAADVAIDAGVAPDEVVVVDGAEKLRPGALIKSTNAIGAAGKRAT